MYPLSACVVVCLKGRGTVVVILGDGTNVQRKTFSHKGIHYPKFNLDSSRPTKKSNVYRLSKYTYVHTFFSPTLLEVVIVVGQKRWQSGKLVALLHFMCILYNFRIVISGNLSLLSQRSNLFNFGYCGEVNRIE